MRGFVIDKKATVDSTRTIMEEFDVRAPGPDTLAAALSGGNNLLFRRNSLDGALEAINRTGTWGGLNSILHAN